MLIDYIKVLKPRESSLLTGIGVGAAIIAGDGQLPLKLLLVLLAVLVASSGANGLTNYIDRDVDARMTRTRNRALPSRRIYPPEKILPLTIGLVILGLGLAWLLHPFSFAANLVGTVAAIVWRKKWTCVFPQGMIASWAPVLMGWFAIEPAFSWEIVLLCILVGAWLPLHVWSIMLTYREEYIDAGLTYFPIGCKIQKAVKVLFAFSLVLYATSVGLYFAGNFHWLYLILANILGIIMVYATYRLLTSGAARNAWSLYKLSAFPYLGLIFISMCVDLWIF